MKKTYTKTLITKEAMNSYYNKVAKNSNVAMVSCGKNWNGSAWTYQVNWMYK